MRKSLEIIVLIFFSLLFLEGCTRVITSFVSVFDIEMLKYSHHLKVYSKNLPGQFGHRANKRIRLMGVDVSTNGIGIRGPDVSIKNSKMRAIFLGDSLTFGWGVDQNKTFSSLTEMNLHSKVEVINFGHCNYNADQEFKLFIQKGEQLNPDVIYMFHFLNDLEPTESVYGVPAWTYSYFISLLVSRARMFYNNLDYRSYYKSFYFGDNTRWNEFKSKVFEFSKEQYQKGRSVKVFILPDFHQMEPYEFKDVHQKIFDELSALGISVIDVLPIFEGEKEAQKYWVAKNDPHPNALAHKKIAELVTSTLKRDYEKYIENK